MPSSLSYLRDTLIGRLGKMDSIFDQLVATPNYYPRLTRYAIQEGIISSAWQSWCSFCKYVIIESVKGAQTKSGVLTTSAYSVYSNSEIAYIAKRIIEKKSPVPVNSLAEHLEPTWGRADTIIKLSDEFNTSNKTQLNAAFLGIVTIKDLHICRNANAHIAKKYDGFC